MNRQKTMKRPAEDVADLRPVEGAAADADLGTLAKALGHPTRVRILRILRGGEGATVTGLVETLALAQSTVSEHLRLLREAGIVTIDAPSRLYRADIHRLRRLKALVGSL